MTTPHPSAQVLEQRHRQLASRSGGVLLIDEPDALLESLGGAPQWLAPLAGVAAQVSVDDLTRFPPPPTGGRASSVLILLGDGPEGPDVVLIERAHKMRQHSGRPAFPGGVVEDTDAGVVAAALREAEEEIGVNADGVRPFAVLPELFVPPSGFVVSPVLAWWAEPAPIAPADPAEVAQVLRVPWQDLINPAHRVRVRHPSGYVGPGFTVRGLTVWGFTGGLLDRIIALAGWEAPWDTSVIVEVDDSPRQ